MKPGWLPDAIVIVALLLVPFAFLLPVTIGGKTLIPADNLYQYEPWASMRQEQGVPAVPHNAVLSDLVLQNYQWKYFIRENVQEGEIPLWQPNQFAGTTFLANGQHSMLYPFSIIFLILPLSSAFGWFAVSQLWLAGVWMYVYTRGIGLSRGAGLMAALTVQLSSFFVLSLVHPMIQAGAAWLPLLLLMIEYTIRQQPFPLAPNNPARMPWIIIGAGAVGMVHLAGHLEVLYYSLLIMAFYAAARISFEWYHHRALRIAVQHGLWLLLLVALGFTIGAVQFIPGVEAANDSFRTERETTTFAQVREFALPERHIAAFLIPHVFGSSAHHSYYDLFDGQRVTIRDEWLSQPDTDPRFAKSDTWFGIKNNVEGGAYLGILPLVLAFIGLSSGLSVWWQQRRIEEPPLRLIFGVLAIFAILFMFGTPAYALLYYGLPGIDQLHTPFRWIWPFTICVAVFAAYGVQTLETQQHSRGVRRLGHLISLTGVMLGMGLLISLALFNQLRSVFEQIALRLQSVAGRVAFVDTEGFFSYQFVHVGVFALLLLASGIILRLHTTKRRVGRGKWRIPLWLGLGAGLIVVDLFVANYHFYTRAESEWLAATPDSVVWLQDQMDADGPFRIQALDFGETPFQANAGWRFGLHDVRGYDSLFSIDYANMLARIEPQGGLDHNRIDPITWQNVEDIASPILDLLNVRYLVTDWVIPPEYDAQRLGYDEVYADTGIRIYENNNVLPRAYTVPLPTNGEQYFVGEGCTDAIPDLDTAEHLTLIPPPSGTCIHATAATITQYDDIEVRADAMVDDPSWLILADSYANGWRAYAKPKGTSDSEEREIDIEQVNYNLRGVQLDAGEWTVRFRYSPRSFQLGAFASFVGGMLAVFLAILWLWNTFIGTRADSDTGQRLIKNSLVPILLNLFNRGIDFAFAFIMLRILGPEDAGIYYYAIVVFGWFDIFTNFGLNTLLTRDVSRDPDAAGRYLFNTSILRLGLATMGIPVLLMVLLFRNATVTPALDSTAVVAIILLYMGLIPNSISTGLTALFYAFEKAEFPAAMTTVSTMVKVTLGLAALLLGTGVIGLAATSILTNLVTFIFLARLAWPLIRDHWQPIADGMMQRAMLREAWPLMINHLLATIFFKSDVILMEAINGVTVVGVYSTAYKWLDALNIIPAFFTMALLPVMARQAHDNLPALKRNYLLGLKLLLMTALPVAALTTFLATGLVGFLGGPAFLPDGATSLQLMIWSIPLGWMNSLTQYVLIALDRQRRITGAFIVAVSFNVISNLVFLPAYSFRAAAITTILSEIVLFVGFWWLLRDVLAQVNWLVMVLRPMVATLVMMAVLLLLWSEAPMLALLLAPTFYGATLLALRPFEVTELQRLVRVIPAQLRRHVPKRYLVHHDL